MSAVIRNELAPETGALLAAARHRIGAEWIKHIALRPGIGESAQALNADNSQDGSTFGERP
jgi:hypothetical protein